MKKYKIIKDSSIFENVINNGIILKNNYFNIFYMPNNLNKPLYGFAVGKKIGNAVCRNKNKRQIKAIVDEYEYLFSKPYYYIIMLKKDINNLSFEEKKEKILNLIQKGDQYEK